MTIDESLPHHFQIARTVIISETADLNNPEDEMSKNIAARGMKILHSVKTQEGWVILTIMDEQAALSHMQECMQESGM